MIATPASAAPDAAAAVLGPGEAVLAFDVGGTDMKAALVDQSGAMREVVRVRTPLVKGELASAELERDVSSTAGTGEAVLAEVARLAKEFADRHPSVAPAAAGLLVPGQVDDESGIGVFAENLGWHNMPFRERASALLDLPVAFSHDVRGAGEAEYRLGAAAAFSDVVVMIVGTGIAAAIFMQGRLYLGGGLAGEIGHSRVADGPQCACGGRGCLEAVASAGAIARRYTALTGRQVTGAKEVLERAADGDSDADAIWQSALDALALGISHTVALLAPEAIIIGGGLAGAGDALFVPLRERLDAILTFHRRPQLIPASIGADAGLIGAALRARDLLASGSAHAVATSEHPSNPNEAGSA
jgi:glucokinase